MHRLCKTFLDCYKIPSIKIRLLMRMMPRGYSAVIRICYRCAAYIRLKIKKYLLLPYTHTGAIL